MRYFESSIHNKFVVFYITLVIVLSFAFPFWGGGNSFCDALLLLPPPADIRGGWSGGRTVRFDRKRLFSGAGGEQERQARQEKGRGRPAAEAGAATASHSIP